MKQLKLFFVMTTLLTGLLTKAMAQNEETLPEVKVSAKTYKYLRAVDNREAAKPVKLLEKTAAEYDIKNAEFYNDENDTYYISFYLPEGYLLAVYDQDGTLLRTAERYKNVLLPAAVTRAVADRYPKWSISKDIYLVNYREETGAKKEYKLVLENGNKRLRVKLDDQGKFLD